MALVRSSFHLGWSHTESVLLQLKNTIGSASPSPPLDGSRGGRPAPFALTPLGSIGLASDTGSNRCGLVTRCDFASQDFADRFELAHAVAGHPIGQTTHPGLRTSTLPTLTGSLCGTSNPIESYHHHERLPLILADLRDHAHYHALHARFPAGFEFLLRSDLSELASGRHEIDGVDLFAIVDRGIGRGKADSPLEYHQRYLDIQYVVSGIDLIGWMPSAECRHLKSPFDADRDLGFFADRPGTWCRVPAGTFAIFYPHDAHAPLGSTGPIHKVVLKVAQ